MTCTNTPGTCSSCGFPITDAPPAHKTSLEPDHLGRIREVCDRCWHNPALFFLPRELEIHGSEAEVLADQMRKCRDTDKRRQRYARRPAEQRTIIPEAA